MITAEILKTIRERIIDSGRDSRYRLQAYVFILSGLDFYRTKMGEKRHVAGQELSHGLAEFASKQFGPIAWDTLKSWGIQTTNDFGYIVYNLIDIQLIRKQDSDSIRDFFDVLDLEKYFAAQDDYVIDPEYIRNVRGS
jgi:uncharacterized repeat protein (TIGR04138 family)